MKQIYTYTHCSRFTKISHDMTCVLPASFLAPGVSRLSGQVVKAAEAQADAAQLQGEGIARQRRAIIDGLRWGWSVFYLEDHPRTCKWLVTSIYKP